MSVRHLRGRYGTVHPWAGPSRDTRIASAWGLRLVFAVNAAFIVALWARGGNLSGLHTSGQYLSSLGRITGLLGSYLLLVQVLLLARLTFLEPLVGFDRLTIWHRRNGKACLSMILAHVVFITLGYAVNDRLPPATEALTLLHNYPGMATATIGTVLLVVVALSSLVIVRRRLRYESWYLVHLTAYVGIYLSWGHQLPTGNEFITNHPAAVYWTALYVATLALLVLFRIARPLLHTLWHRMQVAEVTVEAPNVVSLRITGRHFDKLRARAGQFFLWRFLAPGCWWESHPFSLSQAPNGRSLRITVKNSGDFTSRVKEIAPGTTVIAEGPFGVFTDVVRQRERVALIAGGIGITPIRALVEAMAGDLALIYRAIHEDDLIFRSELECLASKLGHKLFFVVGDHAAPGGERLLSPEHLRELLPDIADREVYICGPPAMAAYIEKNVRQAGVLVKHIHSERFAL